MGVYVPGMEIPKNCHECPIPYPVCFRKNRPQWEVGPHQNCSLVEVPTPHGRLIDADIVTGVIANSMPSLTTPDGAGQYDHEICVVQETIADDIQTINAQPTVIEAEE